MLGNRDRRVFRYVAGYFLSALLDDETAESAKIDVIVVGERGLDAVHESLDDGLHLHFLDTGAFSDFAYDICLSHIFLIVLNKFNSDCKYTFYLNNEQ